MKNVSIARNCQFKEVTPIPSHETLQDSHYLCFPNITTVPVVCPALQPQIASIEGLYRVPGQCELHSSTFTTEANRRKSTVLTKETVLQNISLKFFDRTSPLKIRKINKKRLVTQVSETHTGIIWYMMYVLAIVLIVMLSTIAMIILYRKLKKSPIAMKHTSVPQHCNRYIKPSKYICNIAKYKPTSM